MQNNISKWWFPLLLLLLILQSIWCLKLSSSRWGKIPTLIAHNDAINIASFLWKLCTLCWNKMLARVNQQHPTDEVPNIQTMQDGQTRCVDRKHFFIVLPSHSQPRCLAMYKPSMCIYLYLDPSIPLMIELMSWWTTAPPHATWVLIEIYNILMQVRGVFIAPDYALQNLVARSGPSGVWNPNCTVNNGNHGAVTYLWAKHKFFTYKWLAGLSSSHDLMSSLVILQNSSKL